MAEYGEGMLVSFSTQAVSNRLRALALAGALTLAATLALALPAAADPPSALHPVAPAPAAAAPAAPAACTAELVMAGKCTAQDPRVNDATGAIHDFASNPAGGLFSGALGLAFGGSAGAVPFLDKLMTGTPDLVTGSFKDAWQMFEDAALVMLAIAMVFRLIKQAVAESKSGQGGAINVLLDIGPRLVIFPAMALVSYDVLLSMARVSTTIGASIFNQFQIMTALKVSGAISASPLGFALHVLNGIANPSAWSVTLIGGIVIICMLLYVVMLMAMRFMLLTFMILLAPVAIMCGAYDTNNQLFQWWLTSMIGAMLVPIIVGAVGGLTVLLAEPAFVTGTGGGFLEADVFMIGGLWFMGKVIHHGTLGAFQGKNFSGMLAAAEVGMFAWTRPMNWHRSVPGVGAAMAGGGAGGGGGGSRVLQSAAGAIGGGSGAGGLGGGAGGGAAAEAEAALAPRTPFRRAVETAVANGPLKDDVGAVAAAGGMSDAPLNDQIAFYLEQPYNKEKVFAGMHQEHMTAPGGFINPSDPKNTTEAINANFAAHRPELYGGGGAAPAAAAQARPSVAPIVARPMTPEQIQLIPDAGDNI